MFVHICNLGVDVLFELEPQVCSSPRLTRLWILEQSSLVFKFVGSKQSTPRMVTRNFTHRTRVGEVLVKSCQAWRIAQEEVADRINIIEHAWQRTRLQLEFIERLNLDEEYRRTLDELARALAMRLSAAIATINRAVQQESKKRPGFLGFGDGIKKSKVWRKEVSIHGAWLPKQTVWDCADFACHSMFLSSRPLTKPSKM
jgi:hypothetical protein